MIAMKLETPDKIRKLQRALYTSAKREPEFRFYALYDKTYRKDILAHAYAQCRANRGAAGPDGQSFEDIERSGVEALLTQLAVQLKDKTYRPGPVRRVYIPKSDGGERPLGIPNIADRVVQMAVKLVLEPIYEADFDPSSYGFRPERGAHQALVETRACMQEGIVWVIDADVSKYFDTIPHDRLMKVVATRIVDSSMLALVKLFHTAPVIDEGAGGGPRRPKAGVPQGGGSSPLLANLCFLGSYVAVRRGIERHRSGPVETSSLVSDDCWLSVRNHGHHNISWRSSHGSLVRGQLGSCPPRHSLGVFLRGCVGIVRCVGTHGAAGLDRVMLGGQSVTRSRLGHSPLPVYGWYIGA